MTKLILSLILTAAATLAHADNVAVDPANQLDQCTAFALTITNSPFDERITAKAQSKNLTVRVVAKDKIRYPVTMDYRTNRVNLHIVDGEIVNAQCG